jgi:hypothetical protein
VNALCGLWPTPRRFVAVILDHGHPTPPIALAQTPAARAGLVQWLADRHLTGLALSDAMACDPIVTLALDAQLTVWLVPATLLEAIRTATGFTQRPAKYTAALLARWPSTPALRPYLRRLTDSTPEPNQLCLL